jgi:hypothetical protein
VAVVGLRPSFSAHVRWCERRAPVRSCGVRKRLGGGLWYPTSAKSGQIWGTRPLWRGWSPKRIPSKTRPGPPTQSPEVAVCFSTGEVMGFGPPKVMKNGSYSATSLSGRAPLPFVISTGAQRSGEICGPSWECFSTGRSLLERAAVSFPGTRALEACGLRRKRFVQLYRMSLFCSANRSSALAPSPSRSSLRHMLVRWFSTVL